MKNFIASFGGVILVVAVFLLLNSFKIVQAGHVGVIKRLGAVEGIPLPEGFHLKIPFVDYIEEMDLRLTKAQTDSASSSRDLQTVETKVTVQFSLNGAEAPTTFQKIGNRRAVAQILIYPAIQESVKAVTAQYSAEQLITKREEVKQRIQEAIVRFIETTLRQKKAVGALSIANVAITDFDFSDKFNEAIELKVEAEQAALQAKNEKLRRVTQAEAAAEEKKLAASANAFEIEVQSEARAEAIRREAEALKNNPELIELRGVERWDGQLPKFNGGGAVPFINADKFTQ